MSNSTHPRPNKADLTPHWIAVALMVLLLAGYLIACLTMVGELSSIMPESQRLWLRTLCYVVAIVMFPLTNLIRHIQLRLNQTMPGSKPANKRYLLTVIVSMFLIHSVGVLGVLMTLLGDDANTLYILVGLSVLGAFLYRPKWAEYMGIIAALNNPTTQFNRDKV
jgi:hypothetical protein